jgi:threonylcarbamoyladenosine tRNA methylthiotransferase MtaB
MQFILTTLGCKTNQYESGLISGELISLGFTPAASLDTADVFILNSCTVTEAADKKTRQLLNSAKNKNPDIITVLTGCMPQANPEKAQNLDADVTCGTSKRKELPSLIEKFIKTRTVINKIEILPDIYEDFGVFNSVTGRTRAFIKIQDGCDQNCAYCIVPKARGIPRSRSLESIETEVKAAKKAGYKEIVLTGINLTKHNDLCRAAELAAENTERVRLSSVEPDLLTDEMLKRLSNIKNLCPHFHLSLQSGSNSVLKRMGRHYTADDYYIKIQKIRSLFGDETAFTTDIIVGFPGETDYEFEESINFTRKINFSKIHVFPFSKRSGTLAAVMENQVPESIKRIRRDEFIKTADKMREEFLKAQNGKILSVLTEKENFGHAENYVPVKVKTNKRNEILNVKITGANNQFCEGIEINA